MDAPKKRWTGERLDVLEQKVDDGFARVDKRFDKVDKRFDKVDERFDRLNERFTELSWGLFVAAVVIIAALIAV